MNSRTLNKFFLLLVFFTGAWSLNTQAQSKPEAAQQVEKLLQKATGQKVLNFAGKEEKVVSQAFGENLIAVTLKSGNTNWTKEYTQLPWEQMSTFFYGPAKGNDKVYTLNIKFSADGRYQYFHNSADKGEARNTTMVELYFRKADLEEVKKYMDIINK